MTSFKNIILVVILLLGVVFAQAANKNKKPKEKADKPMAKYAGYKAEVLSIKIKGLLGQAGYYASEKSGKKPLLVLLHGSGGHRRGAGGWCQFVDGFSKANLECDVIKPLSAGMWSPRALDELIDTMIKNYEIDPKCIYVAGFSMGGAGTWAYGFEGKHKVAALVPMGSGASKIKKVHDKWDLNKLKNKPIWMFHGELDKLVPYANAKETADKMQLINPQFKFTTQKGVGHSTKGIYTNNELYTWLIGQSL